MNEAGSENLLPKNLEQFPIDISQRKVILMKLLNIRNEQTFDEFGD